MIKYHELLSEKNKQMLLSYARSCVAAGLAVYMTGNTDPGDIAKAAVAAILPVVIRWANPKDPAFGRTKGDK